jgi:hypothetical protein
MRGGNWLKRYITQKGGMTPTPQGHGLPLLVESVSQSTRGSRWTYRRLNITRGELLYSRLYIFFILPQCKHILLRHIALRIKHDRRVDRLAILVVREQRDSFEKSQQTVR